MQVGNSTVECSNCSLPDFQFDTVTQYLKQMTAILRLVIALVGIVANGLLFVLFRKFSVLKTPANDFVLSLAINDVIILGADLILITRSILASCGVELTLPCLVDNLSLLMTTANLAMLAAIAVERYLFIARPLHYYRIISNLKNYIILSTWLVPASFFTPLFLLIQCRGQHHEVLMGVLLVYFVLLFLTIAGLYYNVFNVAHSQIRSIHLAAPQVGPCGGGGIPPSYDIRSHLRLLRGYFLIVGTTFIAYSLPVFVFYAYLFDAVPMEILYKINLLAAVLATMNNSMNPFVYFYCQSAFKDCFKKLFRSAKRVIFSGDSQHTIQLTAVPNH